MNDKPENIQHPDTADLLEYIKSDEFKEMKEEFPVILADKED